MVSEDMGTITGTGPGNGHSPSTERESPDTARLDIPHPEASSMPVRRRFTAEYKLKVLQEAAQCTQPGEVKALLEREGLYSSYLTAWRRQQKNGTLASPSTEDTPNPSAPKSSPSHHILLEENRRLQQANEELHARLRQAEVTIEVQKKVAEIVGLLIRGIEQQNGVDS